MNVTVKQGKVITIAVSLLIPIVVTVLHYMPKNWAAGIDLSILPLVHAVINGTTFILLWCGLVAIKRKNIRVHKRIMTSCLILSVLFLLSYVTYHSTTESVKYGGEGALKYVYYFILLTHILLSAVIVPFVMVTLFRALTERFDKHRKLAKITFPIWIYVTLTGVLVYIMVSPYY